MTREEAIRIIDDISCNGNYRYTIQKYLEAKKMAIEALSAEPCEDAISRQAVLDLIYNSWKHNGVGENYGELSIDALKALPPVTPKQKMGRWIPVSERLPEDFQRVLVTIVNYNEDRIVRVAEYHHRKGEFQILENHERWEVGEKGLLAWMPLPEPYTAESEETE